MPGGCFQNNESKRSCMIDTSEGSEIDVTLVQRVKVHSLCSLTGEDRHEVYIQHIF